LLALSVMLSVAVRCPASEGVNDTPIVQVPPAATEVLQLFAISAKSPALAPPIVSPAMLAAAPVLFVKVIVCSVLETAMGWFPKERFVEERLGPAGGLPEPEGGPMAIPRRLTVWVPPLALSLRVTTATRLPLAIGVKDTPMVQLLVGPTELPQLLVWAKSLASAPMIARFVMSRIPGPPLLTVIFCTALVVPVERLPKKY
jgi:hypothetical protein